MIDGMIESGIRFIYDRMDKLDEKDKEQEMELDLLRDEYDARLEAYEERLNLIEKDFGISTAMLALLSGIALSLTICHMAGL